MEILKSPALMMDAGNIGNANAEPAAPNTAERVAATILALYIIRSSNR